MPNVKLIWIAPKTAIEGNGHRINRKPEKKCEKQTTKRKAEEGERGELTGDRKRDQTREAKSTPGEKSHLSAKERSSMAARSPLGRLTIASTKDGPHDRYFMDFSYLDLVYGGIVVKDS